MENVRKFKKGEFVFKEGDNPTAIYIVQTGRLGLNVERGGKKLEVTQLGPTQVMGEQALFTAAKQIFTVEALQETKVLEVPIELLKAQFNNAPAGVKVLVKSLVDEIRSSRNSLKSMKMETEKSPCPQVGIPRIFSLLNLVARHTGKKNANNPAEIEVDWGILKLYTARLFAESPQRMRSLVDLLLKLELVELKIITNEEGHEELDKIHIKDVQKIEDFAEFYQYNLYKGSKAEVIYVDTLALKVARALVFLSQDLEPDRKGIVALSYNQLLEEMKKRFGVELKNTHLDILEKKGLFVKRKSFDNGDIQLQFERAEFKNMVFYWSIIHEIDKWNEKGFVDLKEEDEVAQAAQAASCPQCTGMLQNEPRFCPHCGFKLAA